MNREKPMSDIKVYNGQERREGERRKSKDRRDMMRFEPSKEPRRSGNDRRKSSGKDDLWNGRDE